MSLQILTFLLVISALAHALRRTRAGAVAVGFALAFLWLVGSGLLTTPILDRLQVGEHRREPTWASNNVIVLLGWDIVKWPAGEVTVGVRGAARVREAARLYARCHAAARACVILASSGDPTHLGRSEADAMAQALVEIGVPAADIVRESESDNTFQNARYSSALITKGDYDLVVLVTSGFHLRRAQVYFAHFLARPIVGAPADHLTATFTWWPNALNLFYFDLAATEIAGILRYHAYTWLGCNPPAHAAPPID